MPLTRAQYLSGDTADGVVLAGQPQGVKPGGTNIVIDPDGTINAPGLVRLNNTNAYNDYVWTNTQPATTSALTTDNTGVLAWRDVATGFGVTSVDVSGGTTGMVFTGGPITLAGTITMSGVLEIDNGGTNANNRNSAINNLLPSQTGLNTNYFLRTNGTDASWSTAVTSVAASGGTTGLTFSGTPITTTGTLTLGGILGITNGGTNANNRNSAINNLLPSQTGNAGEYLVTNGTDASWAPVTTGTVTSIDVSGGTTGLTFTGGPVTTSGVITMGGVLNITNGGTNANNRNSAINNLLPPQTGNAGEYLVTNGTDASWAPVTTGTVTRIDTGVGLTGGPITTSGTISLANTTVTPNTYTYSTITVDQQGRLTAASNGTPPVTSVSGVAPIVSSGGLTPAISLADTTVTPGTYTYSTITVDQKGRLTAASSGTTPITGVTPGFATTVSSSGTNTVAVNVTPASKAESAAGAIANKMVVPAYAVPKDAAGMSGAAILPSGTDATRGLISPLAVGMLRYNSDSGYLETYTGNVTTWKRLAYVPLEEQPGDLTYVVNQTLNNAIYICRNLTVNAGVVLNTDRQSVIFFCSGDVVINGTILSINGPLGGTIGEQEGATPGFGMGGGAVTFNNNAYDPSVSIVGSGGCSSVVQWGPNGSVGGGQGGQAGGNISIVAQGSITLSNTGTLDAYGRDGNVPFNGVGDFQASGAGGGSGGSVILQSNGAMTVSGQVNVSGGRGGPAAVGGTLAQFGADGGSGGGGGAMVFQAPAPPTVNGNLLYGGGAGGSSIPGSQPKGSGGGGSYGGTGGGSGASAGNPGVYLNQGSPFSL